MSHRRRLVGVTQETVVSHRRRLVRGVWGGPDTGTSRQGLEPL